MYARLLFVVVGISGPALAPLAPCRRGLRTSGPGARSRGEVLPTGFVELRLGIAGGCGYTLAA